MKSLISIRKHQRRLEIMGNTFSNNVAFKGVLDLELATGKVYPLVIHGNTFTSNAGLIDSNVLNIRI